MTSAIDLANEILSLHSNGNWTACHALLARAAASADPIERANAAHWRAVTLRKEGRNKEALDFLVSHRNDFFCKCGVDLARAEILVGIGRTEEAFETMAAAPIESEMATFPAIATELAYYYCLELAKNGRPMPDGVLALIPDDFETFDGRYDNAVGKDYLFETAKENSQA
jgi:hypothetical protein